MTLRGLVAFASFVGAAALSQSGEELHCVGDRPHLLRYQVEGEPNDGSSWKGIQNAVISMEPSPQHAAKCGVTGPSTPSGDKQFCYGVNQDGTCDAAKGDISILPGKLDCKNCFVGAKADVYYALNYSWDKLHSVEVGLRDMHLKGSVSVHAHASGSGTPMKGNEVLTDQSYTVIDKLVGCPVCVKAKVVVAAPTSVQYEVDVQAEADVEAGAELDIDLGDRSIKWDEVQGWTWPKHERTVALKPILELTGKAEGDVKLELDTSLQVTIDDIIWYHLNLKPSLPLTCTAQGNLNPFDKSIQVCLKGDADLTIGHEADLDWNLLSFHVKHHWGPEQDYAWHRDNIVNFCKKVNAPGNSSSIVV